MSLNFLSSLIILNYQKMDRDIYRLAATFLFTVQRRFILFLFNSRQYAKASLFCFFIFFVLTKKRRATVFYYLYSINITYSNMFIIDSVSIVLIGQKSYFFLLLMRLFRVVVHNFLE